MSLLLETLDRIEQTLTIPAAEYVPAIGDVFQIIAAARRKAGPASSGVPREAAGCSEQPTQDSAGASGQDGKECAATGRGCWLGPYGPAGEIQCRYCGEGAEAAPQAAEQVPADMRQAFALALTAWLGHVAPPDEQERVERWVEVLGQVLDEIPGDTEDDALVLGILERAVAALATPPAAPPAPSSTTQESPDEQG